MSQMISQIKNKGHYGYSQKIISYKSGLKKILVTKEYNLLEKYHESMINTPTALATQVKNLEVILSLSRLIKKNWLSMTRDDVNHLVSVVMIKYSDDGQETHSTYDHKKMLKMWFRFIKLGNRLHKKVGSPDEINDVTMKTVADKITREQLITLDDKTRIIKACLNLRDKALIDVHYDAGTRPSELLSLQIKHVKVDKNGAIISVDGKTGARQIRILESTPTLAKWMSTHPFGDDPESPLFINLSKSGYGKPMNYPSANKVLKTACKKAGINRRIYFYLFRHSEATRIASYMPEPLSRKRHGWSPTSKMPSKYAHINGKDVDDAYLIHHGIEPENQDIESTTPIMCPICLNPNSHDAEICDNCCKPLNLEKAILLESKSDEQLQNVLKEMNEKKITDQQRDKRTQEILKNMDKIMSYLKI